MTEREMNWAKQHDWFVHADLDNGDYVVTCRDVGVWPDGTVDIHYPYFTNYRLMREWAGY